MSLTPEWINSADQNPDDHFGFVYLITRLDTGRAYVGRKYFSAAAPKKKGVKRPPRKASNWQRYWGSRKELSTEIAELGHHAFKREIIRWCVTRAETNYAEVEEQIKRDVLKAKLPDGSRAYYNANIMNRYFVSPEKLDDARREEIRAEKTGRKKATNKTGYCGVHKRRNLYIAKIDNTFLGSFETAEQAHEAVEAARAGQPITPLMRRVNKLTAEQVKIIQRMKAEGARINTICEAAGCSRSSVQRVANMPEAYQ